MISPIVGDPEDDDDLLLHPKIIKTSQISGGVALNHRSSTSLTSSYTVSDDEQQQQGDSTFDADMDELDEMIPLFSNNNHGGGNLFDRLWFNLDPFCGGGSQASSSTSPGMVNTFNNNSSHLSNHNNFSSYNNEKDDDENDVGSASILHMNPESIDKLYKQTHHRMMQQMQQQESQQQQQQQQLPSIGDDLAMFNSISGSSTFNNKKAALPTPSKWPSLTKQKPQLLTTTAAPMKPPQPSSSSTKFPIDAKYNTSLATSSTISTFLSRNTGRSVRSGSS